MKTHDELLDMIVKHGALTAAGDASGVLQSCMDTFNATEELYAEIERLRALTTWQPITEAPDDEFVIVWCYGDYGIGRHSICCYDNTRRWLIDGQMAANPSDYHLHVEPTHWMPLPEPPKEDAS